MKTVFENLIQYFQDSKVEFRHIQHAPTYTCEESAKARSESIEIGAKAMLIKCGDDYALFVLSAAKQLDSKKIKEVMSCKSMRFATSEELLGLTTLLPGSVPPFGHPILPFRLYVDLSIQNLPKIAFNAGSLTDSVVLATQDYLRICDGHLCSFSK